MVRDEDWKGEARKSEEFCFISPVCEQSHILRVSSTLNHHFEAQVEWPGKGCESSFSRTTRFSFSLLGVFGTGFKMDVKGSSVLFWVFFLCI